MARLRSPLARAGLLAVEIVGVFLAITAGAAAYLYWRLQAGPVSLDLFRPSAEFGIERSLPPGHDAVVGQARLERGERDGAVDLILSDIAIRGVEGELVADLPMVRARFFLGDVLRGALGPQAIAVEGPVLHIKRRADRAFSLDFSEAAGERNLFRTLTGGRFFRGAFREASLEGAKVYFRDAASGRTWRADSADGEIRRTADGYAANLDGVFDIDGEPASLSLMIDYREAAGRIAAAVRVVEAPVGDILETFLGAGAGLVSSPLTGEAALVLNRAGVVERARFQGKAGAGALRAAGRSFDVAGIEFAATFDPARDAFDLEQLDFEIAQSRGRLGGDIALDFEKDTLRPSAVRFALAGEELLFETDGFLPEALPVSDLSVSGEYRVAQTRLELASLNAATLGVVISGSGTYSPGARAEDGARLSPEIKAEIEVEGALDPGRILLGWPRTLGLGARDFVATRLPRATVENVAFRLDLPAGAMKPGEPMPDEALALSFDIRGATAVYALGMTPLAAAGGSALLTGNRFRIDNVRGRVGDIPVTQGEIDFTALSPRGQPVYFRFAAAGEARRLLGVLNEEPLSLLRQTGLDPERVLGDARISAEIMRPNLRDVPRDEYGYKGSATFSDLSIFEFYDGIDLLGARGEIDLATRQMILKADAELGGAPIELEWTQRFYRQDGPSRFRVRGDFNSATADIFGVPTRRYIRGSIPFDAVATGSLNAIDTLSLTADFTETELHADVFDWRKPQGVRTTGALDFSRDDEGFTVERLRLEGDGVDILGGGALSDGGAIRTLSFDRFFLEDAADFSVSAARNTAGMLDLTLTGRLLDAGGLVEDMVSARPEGGGENAVGGLSLRARIDELRLRKGAVYQDASLDFRRNAERILGLQFSARTSRGAPLSVSLGPTGAERGPSQVVEARTDDIGALLTGVFGLESVYGGEGSMEVLVHARSSDVERGLSGVMQARNMHLVRAPLLARIFAVGSLDGLGNLLSGEGIFLNRAYAAFDFHDGLLDLKEARASGPSVGITGSGSVETREGGGISLSGAVAPAYQVNSLLGRAPLIGDLFVSREGEGVVALSYTVGGATDAPAVTVNPLSALTPGFLRRMFEVERAAPGAAVEDLDTNDPDTDYSEPEEPDNR